MAHKKTAQINGDMPEFISKFDRHIRKIALEELQNAAERAEVGGELRDALDEGAQSAVWGQITAEIQKRVRETVHRELVRAGVITVEPRSDSSKNAQP